MFPASLPEVFTALRIGSGTAIAVLFLAESIAGSSGLGWYIVDAWGRIDYPAMFAGIIAMGLLGVVLYEALDAVERWATQVAPRGAVGARCWTPLAASRSKPHLAPDPVTLDC